MNTRIIALLLGLSITAPICAEMTSTYSNTTLTVSDDETMLSTTTRSNTDYSQSKDNFNFGAKILKAYGIVFGAFGAPATAISYKYYEALKALPLQDVKALSQQYTASMNVLSGAVITGIGACLYYLGYKIEKNPSYMRSNF